MRPARALRSCRLVIRLPEFDRQDHHRLLRCGRTASHRGRAPKRLPAHGHGAQRHPVECGQASARRPVRRQPGEHPMPCPTARRRAEGFDHLRRRRPGTTPTSSAVSLSTASRQPPVSVALARRRANLRSQLRLLHHHIVGDTPIRASCCTVSSGEPPVRRRTPTWSGRRHFRLAPARPESRVRARPRCRRSDVSEPGSARRSPRRTQPARRPQRRRGAPRCGTRSHRFCRGRVASSMRARVAVEPVGARGHPLAC